VIQPEKPGRPSRLTALPEVGHPLNPIYGIAPEEIYRLRTQYLSGLAHWLLGQSASPERASHPSASSPEADSEAGNL